MVTLLAPAKLNLTLYVLGRRRDGYHEIRSLMVPVSLFDKVTVETSCADSEGGGEPRVELRVTGGLEGLKKEDNLAWKAAQLFLERFSIDRDVRIELEKAIPTASGLGGGSADAAAVLVALARLCGTPPENELRETAAALGSDVPFCLHSWPAVVEGRGENVHLVRRAPEYLFVLIRPRFELPTRAVYEAFDRIHPEGRGPGVEPPTIEEMADAYARGELALHNDLLEAALSLRPEVGGIIEMVRGLGVKSVSLSGSGPTVFAAFTDRRTALETYDYFLSSPQLDVFLVHSIAGWHRLQP